MRQDNERKNPENGKREERSNINPQLRDPRSRQTWNPENDKSKQFKPMSQAPKRDTSGKRQDIDE